MRGALFISAILKYLLGVILIGLLLFLPAGSFGFLNGWLLLGILFVPMFFAGLIMLVKNPELLKRRLNAKEETKNQSAIVKLSGLMFLLGFVVAALNYRFSWYMLPKGVSIAASVVFLVGYALYAVVLKQNTYLSRTIEIQEHQKVIDRGLYGVVRHPMYTATILMFLSVPLVLGSLISFAIFLCYPILIIVRLKDEERLLEKELDGYSAYKSKVRYRLIPFIW